MTPHIYLDRSGDLQDGYFYTVDFDEDVNFPDRTGPGEFLVKLIPREEELVSQGSHGYFWAMFASSFDFDAEQQKDCPVDHNHVTQSWWRDLKVAVDSDATRVGVVAPFVNVLSLHMNECALLIRDDLVEALNKSGLTGWRTEEVIFAVPSGKQLARTSEADPYPRLWYFQFRGRARLRSRSVRNAPNACPFCGHGRIICPGCRWRMVYCAKCEGFPYETPTQARDMGQRLPKGTLFWEDTPEARRGILQGEHWDGSDFVQIGVGCGPEFGLGEDDEQIITKRALDWLLARHAMPLWAQPIPVDVAKMNKEQRKRLEDAKGDKSLEAKK